MNLPYVFARLFGKWFQQKQLSFTETSFPLLNDSFIKTKITEHTQQQADQRAFLWNLWVFNRWNLAEK